MTEHTATVMTVSSASRLGPDSLLTTAETAEVLRTSVKTLERWRANGSGPKAARIGPRRIAYRVRDVLEFASSGEPA